MALPLVALGLRVALPWLAKQLLTRPVTTLTAAHIASDGASTRAILDGAETIVPAVVGPETAKAAGRAALSVATEVGEAWTEMGGEVARRGGEHVVAGISSVRHPFRAAAVQNATQDAAPLSWLQTQFQAANNAVAPLSMIRGVVESLLGAQFTHAALGFVINFLDADKTTTADDSLLLTGLKTWQTEVGQNLAQTQVAPAPAP